MIDINTYRRRIGCFNPAGIKSKNALDGQGPDDINFYVRRGLSLKFGFITVENNILFCVRGNGSNLKLGLLSYYLYYILYLIFISSNIMLSEHFLSSCGMLPNFISNYNNFGLPNVSTIYVRLAFFAIICFVMNNFVRGHGPLSKFKRITPATLVFGGRTSRVRQLVAFLLIFISLLTFLMIGIVNTSLLNPGPRNLKVYYQNVQGLIPFSNLKNVHPVLDRTKICELNSYIQIDKPDIIILNETWLKKSIGDYEVIEDTTYKIFRKDRSILSHPIQVTQLTQTNLENMVAASLLPLDRTLMLPQRELM